MKSLAELGYKDPDLYEKISRKLIDPNLDLGLFKNEEFSRHIRTLLAWRTPEQVEQPVQETLSALVEDSQSGKDLQRNLAEGLVNIRSSYYELIQAQQHPAVRNNSEIAEELAELQESLVKASLINPEDFEDERNFTDLPVMMQRASEVFNDLVSTYYPSSKQPIIDAVYEASKLHTAFHLPVPQETLEDLATSAFDSEILGITIAALGKSAKGQSTQLDSKIFPNALWGRYFKRGFADKSEENSEVVIEERYSESYRRSRGLVEEILKTHGELIETASFTNATLLLKGMADTCYYDQSPFDKAVGKLKTQEIDRKILPDAIYALGVLPHDRETADSLISAASTESTQYSFDQLVSILWTACVHDLKGHYHSLITTLNEYHSGELTNEQKMKLRDIKNTLEAENAEFELSDILRQNLAFAMNDSALKPKRIFDPVKPHLTSLIKGLMGRGLTHEETEYFYNQLKGEEPSVYSFDDMIVVNGKKTPVFILGAEQIDTGNHVLRVRNLEKLGYYPLTLCIEEILNIDYATGHLTLNENFDLRKVIDTPINYLAPLEEFTHNFVEFIRTAQGAVGIVQLIGILKGILGLHKLQNISRLKVSEEELSESLEDLKLQVLRVHEKYQSLNKTPKETIDSLGNGNFSDLLKSINSSIPAKKRASSPNWAGARQQMEVLKPGTPDITQEIINQGFLWNYDYFHYDNWGVILRQNYPLDVDMYLPKDDFYNNSYFGDRRQLHGITPNTHRTTNSVAVTVKNEAKFIANLANIKYEIKRNLSDEQILEKVLNLKFIEKLMSPSIYKKESLVPRDPDSYIDFLIEQTREKANLSQYKQFFKKEHDEKELKDNLFMEVQNSLKVIDRSDVSWNDKTILKNRLIDKYMRTSGQLNHDDPERYLTLQTTAKQTYESRTDNSTLAEPKASILDDPDYGKCASSQEFLLLKIRKSRANLIKTRIFYKIFNEQSLSQPEQDYLANYLEALKNATFSDIGSVCIPKDTLGLKLSALEDSDREFFNSLRNVNLSPELDSFSLSDLIFELSHFIDENFIRKIESLIIEKHSLDSWGITQTTSGIPRLFPALINKTLLMENARIDEFLWRNAGIFTESDINGFFGLIGILRGKSYADRIYWELDKQSFTDFLGDANSYDNRLKFIKEWTRRKYEENKEKKAIPRDQFANTDKDLGELLRNAQEKELKSVLELYTEIKWDDINHRSLTPIVQFFKETVNQGNMPNSFVKILKAVLLHPRFDPRDKEELVLLMRKYRISVEKEGSFLFESPVALRGDRIPQFIVSEILTGDPIRSLIEKL